MTCGKLSIPTEYIGTHGISMKSDATVVGIAVCMDTLFIMLAEWIAAFSKTSLSYIMYDTLEYCS